MTALTYMLILAVGLLNVIFNIQMRRAAIELNGAFGIQLLLPFTLGCLSFTSLYFLYAQGIILARGITLMGAVSILGGAAYGTIIQGNRLDTIERVLLIGIGTLLLYRLWVKDAGLGS